MNSAMSIAAAARAAERALFQSIRTRLLLQAKQKLMERALAGTAPAQPAQQPRETCHAFQK